MIFDGFISGMYTHRSRAVDLQECVNWYPEVVDPNSKNSMILAPTPGTVLFTTAGTQTSRGIYTSSGGSVFYVNGKSLFEILSNGTHYNHGSLRTHDTMVSMADNGNQLIIVDGTYGYILDLATKVFSLITSSGFPSNCTHVQFLNGRFVANNSQIFQYNLSWSDLYDGFTWNGLSVASTEYLADKLVAISKANNQLWLFGERTTEVFWDTGDADQPFQRIQGAAFDNGTAAPYSPASTGNIVFWIGSNTAGNGIIWRASGYQPERISNHAIEYLLQSFEKVSDAIGYCYQQEGHVFYVLTFPTANRTLVYDLTTEMWHERSNYNNLGERDDAHIGNCACFAYNRTLVGSRVDGNVYYYDKATYTDNGNTIRRIRTAPHVHNENKRVFYKSFELDVEKGRGLTEGQGSVPDIVLQYSNDGGFTWNPELWKSAGRIGIYKPRVKWFNLGHARDRVFRVIYTDPVPCHLINAWIDVESER